ncbi:MAG: alpha-1,4-glucan--maltose-1-phosphate maltosyltransferase [Bryobacterales bacterium]|nr:alpha-1,4-glucan--maltose-1-phosphate maltosyltransferase [Bryobacterales bacterium]
MQQLDGRKRVVIETVKPEIECGRFPIKRVVGDSIVVAARVFADGHDMVSAGLIYSPPACDDWIQVKLSATGNDWWQGNFTVDHLGVYRYSVRGWVDRFKTWRRDTRKKLDAGQDVSVDLITGGQLLVGATERAHGSDLIRLRAFHAMLDGSGVTLDEKLELALGAELARLMEDSPDITLSTRYEKVLEVIVDRKRAVFGAWYEMFPRSASPDPHRTGTLADVEARLPYVAGMGFDVLYLPPIHPIGRAYRKGKNNAAAARPNDAGSPWAIGSVEGGHQSIHPDLGTLDDFRRLVERSHDYGVEIAIDIAFQCSPDHPWVKEHPQWFRHRPDGTIQYAENPPKKYQDIYPIDFETADWENLWKALHGVLRFWLDQGVRIFRVDNPHTKAFPFWEWVIREVKRECPSVIFLAEAFTRPAVMYRLAKLGFTQSYTYFAWKRWRWELAEYARELAQTEAIEYFRPNFWPNTPDILTDQLQTGSRAMYQIRLILAATLSSSYGIYGPVFELMEHEPLRPASEEYLDSEKYQVRHWDLNSPDSLAPLITRVNQIRRENPALHSNWRLQVHETDNDALLCYSKRDAKGRNTILVVVNLDPGRRQWGFIHLDMAALGLRWSQEYQAHDLLTGARYGWLGARNYVELDPGARVPAHIFRIE